MKKFILPIIFAVSFLFLFTQNLSAQEELDCRKIFDKESYKCLTDSSVCSDACMKETEKPDGSAYFNSGEIYKKCMKASNCDGKSSICNEQAMAKFRACSKSDSQSKEAKKETATQDKKGLNIFKIFDLFSKAVTNLATKKDNSDSPQEEAKLSVEELSTNNRLGEQQTGQQLDDWITENDLISDPALLEQMEREKLDLDLYGRTPKMTEEIVMNAQSEWEAMFTKTGKESVMAVNGQGQLESPGLDQFISVTAKDDPIYYTYFGEVVSVPKWAEIKFLRPVQDEKTQELKRMLKFYKGEVEIKVKNDAKKEKFGVQGDFFDLFVIQTHFWVNQSQDKRMAVIGVYEGEVEVKTRDGKTVRVKPDGDRPGIVVVSQKLSLVKLGIPGLVLAVIIGRTIWFIKRRSSFKTSKKKSR